MHIDIQQDRQIMNIIHSAFKLEVKMEDRMKELNLYKDKHLHD